MEWALIPLVLLVALCPLMMIGMMVGGWLFMRGRAGSPSGHGMMMCMGHGGHGDGRAQAQGLVEELKAQRQRLDELIARAEEGVKTEDD